MSKLTETVEKGRPKQITKYITTGSTIRDLIIGGAPNCFGYKVGSIVNLVGDSSSGKCLRNSYILTENGFEYINDFAKEKPYGFTEETHQLALEKDVTVESSHIYKEQVDHTIKIITSHGYEIEGTPNHPIAIWAKGGYILKKLKDITKKDVVIIAKETNIYGQLQKVPTEFITKYNEYIVPNALPQYITEGVAYMIGSVMAGGTFPNIFFKKQAQSTLHDFSKKFCENPKRIPKVIMQSPKRVQIAFLKGIKTSGSFGYNMNSLTYLVLGEHIATQLSLLLLNMGIITEKKKISEYLNKQAYYIISIDKDSVNLYDTIINNKENISFSTEITTQKYFYDQVEDVLNNYFYNTVEGTKDTVDVYDVHVPEGHLFWCNGMINHNTALAVQTAVANMHALGDKFAVCYDDAENGMSFDIEKMFGMDKPLITKDTPHSQTVEDLYINIYKFEKSLKKNQIGLYILDSLDGLTSKKQVERNAERIKKAEQNKEFDEGTYGLNKQKFLSQEFFPDISSRIENSNMVLLIISQVRDNINAGSYGKKHVRAGGRALQFYCHTVEWLAEVQKSEMIDEKTGLKAGGVVFCETTKSKTTRPYRKNIVIYDYSIGVDDIASCIDYLYDLRKNKNGTISKLYKLRATKRDKIEWDGELFERNELCDYIYDKELEKELRKRVIEKWEIEQASTINRRKPRF